MILTRALSVICSSRKPRISMQFEVKWATPGPSQPLRFCLTAATHFRSISVSIGNANTEMVAVATLPHPAATHTPLPYYSGPNGNVKTEIASSRYYVISLRAILRLYLQGQHAYVLSMLHRYTDAILADSDVPNTDTVTCHILMHCRCNNVY